MAGRTFLVVTVLPFLCFSCVSSAWNKKEREEPNNELSMDDSVAKLKLIQLCHTKGLVTKCKSDNSKCLKESAQALIPVFANGIPEYNVKTLDPVSFKAIDASTPNLKLQLSDITVTGLKDCIARKIKRDKAKNRLFVKLLCSCQVEGQYEMDGKLLFLPIKGKGPLHVTLRKIEIIIEGGIGEIEKGGISYWDIKEWKHSFTLKDKTDVVFENLFNGNEILAQAARDVISNSGNEIILEVGTSTIKTVVVEVVNNVKNFFHTVPVQELSID